MITLPALRAQKRAKFGHVDVSASAALAFPAKAITREANQCLPQWVHVVTLTIWELGFGIQFAMESGKSLQGTQQSDPHRLPQTVSHSFASDGHRDIATDFSLSPTRCVRGKDLGKNGGSYVGDGQGKRYGTEHKLTLKFWADFEGGLNNASLPDASGSSKNCSRLPSTT